MGLLVLQVDGCWFLQLSRFWWTSCQAFAQGTCLIRGSQLEICPSAGRCVPDVPSVSKLGPGAVALPGPRGSFLLLSTGLLKGNP